MTAFATPAPADTPSDIPPVMPPDWAYLEAHGFDPVNDILRFPLGAVWHTFRKCLHPACDRPAPNSPWLCFRCRTAYYATEGRQDVAGWCASAPAPPDRRTYGESRCVVGCARPAEVGGLCKTCNCARRPAHLTVEQYLATGPAPRPGFGTCRVAVCPRMAEQKRTRLCGSHNRQWLDAGRPDLAAWAATADPVYTAIDEVPLSGLHRRTRLQVLRGYELQLRDGGRLSPSQVKSSVVWLRCQAVDDLINAPVPAKGAGTTYVRVWRDLLERGGASPDTELARTVIRIYALSPRYGRGSGSVYLSDVQAPWLVHLAQCQVKALVANNASASSLQTVGHAVRWFALFLRDEWADEGRHARSVGRPGVVAFLRWLDQRAADSVEYQRLASDDPRRDVIGDRLLASLSGTRISLAPGDSRRKLIVSPQRHFDIISRLKDTFDRHRDWLVANGAGDVYITDDEVPAWPTPDRSASEEEGRSDDALPETVFFQLMRPESLELLGEGSRRNAVELTARLGRRPWELRHLRYECLEWNDVTIERADGTRERRRYPFLVYWMQKTRKRHVLPLHESDAAVVERQKEWLRSTCPGFFDATGRPLSPELLLFPTSRKARKNTDGTHPYEASILPYWLKTWVGRLPPIYDDNGEIFDTRNCFSYAFRHTYAQLRADAGVDLDVLQELMGHELPTTTQVYYRVSTGRRASAVAEIAAKYRFDITGDRIRSQTPTESDTARIRAGVASVPVPAGSCHEMNNVRADGNGCPIFYRCFSCTFYSTDFTHLGELRQLRADKAEQLARLEAGYGTLFRAGPLAEANLTLLRQEIAQLGELIAKCEADVDGLSPDERAKVEQWLASKERFDVIIPVEAVRARRRQLDQPTVDPATIDETRRQTGTSR
jgi:integrase